MRHFFSRICFHCLETSPEKFVYQYEAIVSGEFTLVNDNDARLGQGSNEYIDLIPKLSVIVVHQRKLARYNCLILVHKFLGRAVAVTEIIASHSELVHKSLVT